MKHKSLNILKITCIIALLFCIVMTTVFIFSNSVKSRELSSEQSGEIAQVIKPVVDPENKIPFNIFENKLRKAAHFTEFMLLGFEAFALLTVVSKKAGRFDCRGILFVLLFLLIVANIDETIQLFTQRGSSVLDVWIDFCGGIFGCFMCAAIYFIAFFIKKSIKYQENHK